MFIKKINFIDNVDWFENWTEIEFKNEQNELIDFYLKNTDKIKEWEKYINKFSDRIQINCILWKNWAGKTKLLSNIMHFFKREKFDLENEKSIKFSHIDYEWNKRKIIVSEEIKFNDRDLIKSKITDNSSIIFDDFFIGSDMFYYSVNKDIALKFINWGWLNEFYCEVYNFLQNENNKWIFSEFLNINKDYNYKIYISFNNDWYKKYWWSHVYFLENSWKNFETNSLFINDKLEYQKILDLFDFLYSKINGIDNINYPNLNKLIGKELAIDLYFSLSDLLIATLNYCRDNLNDYNINSEPIEFINIDWYGDFINVLKYTKLLLELVLEKWKLSKHPVSKVQFQNPDYSDKSWLSYNDIIWYINNWIKNIDFLFKVFDNIEKWISVPRGTHSIFRRVSWYEKSHVQASDYFLLELMNSFTDNSQNDLISTNFKNIIYYNIRNVSNEIIRNKWFKIDDFNILLYKEKSLLSFWFFDFDLKFYEEEKQKEWIKKITQEKSFNHLSSWEKVMLIRFVNVYKKIIEENEKNWKKHFVILVDEPDLHLHLEWQQVYIQRLIDVFSTIWNDITMHFIIATHSPFIISDLPKENIIKLKKWKNSKTELDKINIDETFWANYIDIIRNGFFDGVFLWNFSKEIIWKIADNERKAMMKWKINFDWEDLKDFIWDDFLKDNLLYFKPKKDDKNSSK